MIPYALLDQEFLNFKLSLYTLITWLSRSVYSFIYKVLARLGHGCDMVVTSMSTTLLQPCHNSYFVVKAVATLYKLVVSVWVVNS